MKDLIKIIRFTGSLWRYYAVISFFVIFAAVLNLVNPFITRSIVDGVVAHLTGHTTNVRWLEILVVAMFVIQMISVVLSNINGYLGDLLSARINSLLSRRYYAHILNLPISYYDNEITGKITARLERSINTISNLMQAMVNNLAQMVLTIIFTLVAIAIFSWPVAVLLAILFPLYVWLTRRSSKAWQEVQKKINYDVDLANGRFVESVGQIRVVKSFVTELRELSYFSGKRDSIESLTKVQSARWHWYDAARRTALAIIFFGIYGIIFYQTYVHQITIGTMTLLITLTTMAQGPLNFMSGLIDNLQRAIADSRDYFAVMDTEPDIVDDTGAETLKVTKGKIEFKDVDFAYKAGAKVLEKISFAVKASSKLALVGESGEGKTTISNLLLRFYEPSGGQITIDGQDISRVTQSSLRAAVGVVFQDPSLFSGSIRDNITYGYESTQKKMTKKALEKATIDAAKAANADEFIRKLSRGYDTEIGERGVKLSGGQKQRIAIARAILKNPPILILDEATSSLDSRAEREVQDALEHLMHGRTTIIIAHRLSTIASVDAIAGISGGRVVEFGTPAKLAQKSRGIYAELLHLQTDANNKALLSKYQIAKS